MKRALVLGGALLALSASAAAAQEFGIDMALNSRYEWRGLSLTNKPVLQPAAWLSFPAGPVSITGGGWSNVELGTYDGNDDISENGEGGAGLTEFDWYAELGFSAGIASLTAGATGYIYTGDKNDAGFINYTSTSNTTEIYGKAELGILLSPSLAVYYDVDLIKGAYIEAGVSHGIGPITLGALAGFSAGQEVDSDPSANFAESGLTHIDVSASASFPLGPISIDPTAHVIFGVDDWTQISSPKETDTAAKFWIGATISWSHAFGGGEE